MRDELISIAEEIKRKAVDRDSADLMKRKAEYIALAESLVEILN